MSNIFGPISRRTGVINYSTGDGPLPADSYFAMGVWFAPDGRVLATTNDPAVHWSNGLPFSEDGRLVVFGTGAPDYFDQGMSFYESGGRMAIAGSGNDHADQGSWFNFTSGIRVSTAVPAAEVDDE